MFVTFFYLARSLLIFESLCWGRRTRGYWVPLYQLILPLTGPGPLHSPAEVQNLVLQIIQQGLRGLSTALFIYDSGKGQTGVKAMLIARVSAP